MRSTFKILFYVKRNAIKKDGTVPIFCRITINGTIAHFSCRLFVNPMQWDVKSGQTFGNDSTSRRINTELNKIRKGVSKHFDRIFTGIGPLTAERVKISYCGFDRNSRTLLQVFENHNREFAQLVKSGVRQLSSYNKYCSVFNHLKEFLYEKYKLKDIALIDIRPDFIVNFEIFLRRTKGCVNNTVYTYLNPLRRMILIARNNGWLDYNPFGDYRITMKKTDRVYLTMDEIYRIKNIQMMGYAALYGLVQDLFIFCCFTGVSYIDLKNLTTKNLKQTEKGIWLCFERHKTGISCNIPLLDIPLGIITKYRAFMINEQLFSIPSYSTLLYAIKRIAKLCNIEKHISWHTARHTFATEICLQNGVPIETISRMLGHTDVKTTQIYARISNTVIQRDMAKLAEQLAVFEK